MLSRNVLVLMLSACELSQQQQVDYDAVQHSKSSPAIYDKMVHGDPLSVSDIIELTRARVNDGIILRYIRDRETIYVLNGIDSTESTQRNRRGSHAKSGRFPEHYRLHFAHGPTGFGGLWTSPDSHRHWRGTSLPLKFCHNEGVHVCP